MNNKEFLESILQKLDFVNPLKTKNMFGTIALISNEHYFGSIAKEKFYLKVDDISRPDFVDYGMEPYRTKRQAIDYYEVPPAVLNDNKLLQTWVNRALNAVKGEK